MNKKATKRNNNNINKIIENKKGRIIMKATGVVRRIDDLGREKRAEERYKNC